MESSLIEAKCLVWPQPQRLQGNRKWGKGMTFMWLGSDLGTYGKCFGYCGKNSMVQDNSTIMASPTQTRALSQYPQCICHFLITVEVTRAHCWNVWRNSQLLVSSTPIVPLAAQRALVILFVDPILFKSPLASEWKKKKTTKQHRNLWTLVQTLQHVVWRPGKLI